MDLILQYLLWMRGGGREGCAWCDTIELHASYDPLLFRLMAEKDKLEMKLNIQGEKKDD